MTSSIKFSTLIFLSLVFLASCTKSAKLDETANAIPKNAVSVTAINLPSLMQKADFESVKQMDFYKAMVDSASSENAAIAEILRDPKKSGVDFSKNIYIVQDYSFLTGGGDKASGAVLLSLTDAGAFEKMLTSGKNPAKVETKDGIKYLVFADQNTSNENGINVHRRDGSVAWNDKMAVLGGNTEGGNMASFFKNKAEESIAKNEKFAAMFNEQHDIYSYSSFDKFADNPEIKSGAGMMNIDPKALKGNYTTGYADFEKGQIVGKSDYQINKEIRNQWGLVFKNNVKTDFSKYLKGENIGFAATLALDAKGVKEIINANPQYRIMIESAKSDKFSVDDVFKALDGDIVIAANPNANKDDKKWNGMIGFKLSDKATMEKLINYLISQDAMVSEGNGVYRFGGMADMMSKNYVENGKVAFVDDVLFMGDAGTITNLKNGSAVSGDVKDVLNKNIFGLYANFSKIFADTEGMHDPEMTELKMMMNGKHGEGTMKMKDQNENSLKSLMKAVNRWYLKNKADEAKRKAETPKQEI